MNESESLIVKLIVPASQCGPLIGKGGSKIKEIRDSTGAAMQVAADMLPNSTERIVNISGSVEAILDCIYEISLILLSVSSVEFYVKLINKYNRTISNLQFFSDATKISCRFLLSKL